MSILSVICLASLRGQERYSDRCEEVLNDQKDDGECEWVCEECRSENPAEAINQ